MNGYEVKFRIWADSKEEADTLGLELQKFVNDIGQMGIYVTANKTREAISKWQSNQFIKSKILKNYEN